MSLYAAYAGNLDARLMTRRAPHSPMRATGWLNGWRLTFGGEHMGWEGALATIVEDPLCQVFVALYEIAPADDESMDRWEGVGLDIYRRTRIRVHTLEGEEQAWTYVLNGYEGGLPSARYLGEVADAAESAGAPTTTSWNSASAPAESHRSLASHLWLETTRQRSPSRQLCHLRA